MIGSKVLYEVKETNERNYKDEWVKYEGIILDKVRDVYETNYQYVKKEIYYVDFYIIKSEKKIHIIRCTKIIKVYENSNITKHS